MATRIITEGCRSRAGGSTRFITRKKAFGYDGVGFGGGQHPLHAPVPQPHRHRTPTLNLRQGKIGSRGLLPCRTYRLRNVSAEWNSYREPRCTPRDRLTATVSHVPSARCGWCSTRTSRSAAAAWVLSHRHLDLELALPCGSAHLRTSSWSRKALTLRYPFAMIKETRRKTLAPGVGSVAAAVRSRWQATVIKCCVCLPGSQRVRPGGQAAKVPWRQRLAPRAIPSGRPSAL